MSAFVGLMAYIVTEYYFIIYPGFSATAVLFSTMFFDQAMVYLFLKRKYEVGDRTKTYEHEEDKIDYDRIKRPEGTLDFGNIREAERTENRLPKINV